MQSPVLNRRQVREVDRRAIEEFGLPGVVLMENAGRGAAELLLRLGVRGRVVICCGKGNNGGDGYVIGRHLDNHGIAVRVLRFTRPGELTGDAAINHHVLTKTPVSLVDGLELDPAALAAELAQAEWVVDALLGTGLTGKVRSPLDHVIAAINASQAKVLAVDLPSGLDCDTGEPLGVAVRAHHTATFVAPKPGFTVAEANAFVGVVHVVDIGVPRCLLAALTTEAKP